MEPGTLKSKLLYRIKFEGWHSKGEGLLLDSRRAIMGLFHYHLSKGREREMRRLWEISFRYHYPSQRRRAKLEEDQRWEDWELLD